VVLLKKALPIFIGLIIVLPFLLIPRRIIINKFSCSNQFGPCSEAVLNLLNDANTGNLNLLKAKQNVENVLESEVLIKSFATQYKFPDVLEVFVFERKSAYALMSGNESILLIDKEGYVISITDETGLPNLKDETLTLDVGEKVDDQRLFALEVYLVTYSNYQIEEANLYSDRLVIELDTNLTVIFPLEGSRDVLLGSLRLILAELNNENINTDAAERGRIRTIDLRFENPVLKYK